MNKVVRIYNSFSIICTTEKEQEDLTSAYLDNDWTEIGRIIHGNVTLEMAQSEANLLASIKRAFGFQNEH